MKTKLTLAFTILIAVMAATLASDRTTLKSYFQTGDKPSQANFEDLIDSVALASELSDVDQVANAVAEHADQALAAATAASAKSYVALLKATYNGSTWTINRNEGSAISSVATQGTVFSDGKVVRVTFASAVSSNLLPCPTLNRNGGAANGRNCIVIGQNTSYVEFLISETPLTSGTVLYCIFF